MRTFTVDVKKPFVLQPSRNFVVFGGSFQRASKGIKKMVPGSLLTLFNLIALRKSWKQLCVCH